MPAEHVLFSQVVDAREVISPLVGLHPLEHLDCDGPIEPCDVPLRVLSLRQVVLEVELGDLLDHIVVRVVRIHSQPIGLVSDLFCV